MAKFCKKCGTQLADEAVFCPNCGAAQNPAAPQQPQQQESPQPQPQPQQPQPQPQPQPQAQKAPKSGNPVFAASDIGFKGADFPKHPVKEFVAGDLSRFSIVALFLTLSSFFLSMINIFSRGGMSASMLTAFTLGGYGALHAFHTIFMIILISAIVWLLFKMFLKRVTWFDLAVSSCALTFWFLINMIGMIVLRGGISFAGVLFYLVVLAAIAVNIFPLIIRIIRKGK